MTKFHPVETADPEGLVVAWIAQESSAPRHLADTLRQYRDLVLYMDAATTTVAEADAASGQADTLYDRLVSAATVTLRISAKAEAQLRRIARKEEASLTLRQRWDRAIARRPQAQDWGIAAWYTGPVYQVKAGVRP